VAAHHDLIPYTRSALYEATQTGMPVMRSLVFAYPHDDSLNDTWDEYLYGDSLLVAPVTTAKAENRSVYLPAGRWMNYNDKRTTDDGRKTVTADVPLGRIPVFVREGAIIPRGDIVKLNNNWDANWTPKLRIEVFAAAKEPSRFDYFTGAAVHRITASRGGETLTIQFDDLGGDGFLEVYCRKATEVTRNGVRLREGSGYAYDTRAQKLTVPIKGATKVTLKNAASLF
jgi:alpha-D-xyloside xylohydrolase